MAMATGLRCVKLDRDSMTQSRTMDDCPAPCSVWNTCEETAGPRRPQAQGCPVSAGRVGAEGPAPALGALPRPLTWYTTVAMNCGYGCWLDRNSPMTLFMTSWGGKKSSRNWGRTRATTRASQGNPFRILWWCGGSRFRARPACAPQPRGSRPSRRPEVTGRMAGAVTSRHSLS